MILAEKFILKLNLKIGSWFDEFWFEFVNRVVRRRRPQGSEILTTQRNSITGESDTPDKVWEIQHTPKDDRGKLVWLDSQSQQIHGQLQEVVAQQQSKEIEHPMTRDEILSSVVGKHRGQRVRQEMQAEMDRKLQEEREQMVAELRRNMEIELERKLVEERQHANEERQHANAETDKRICLEVEKKMHEQFASFLTRMQQQQSGRSRWSMGLALQYLQ
ncbi:hypothetical protein A4A49_39179 [Nicotiana attenuata]|uniref:Uncharacterized protein n=1 Tax=Nicotiana attenuata TaxID=49451 RepID=A0A1J6L3C8_NICAT|nr:hypothetical protein A4A49_39179 [Nicotiana attenuata]